MPRVLLSGVVDVPAEKAWKITGESTQALIGFRLLSLFVASLGEA